jgi:hypothetical protein
MELVRAVLERLSGHITNGYRLEPVAVQEQSRELLRMVETSNAMS